MAGKEAACPVNELRSELKYVADLQELVALELPNLQQGVAILAETLPLDVTPEETLKGQVSAEATWVLEFLLNRAGYTTERWERQLPDNIPFETFRSYIYRYNRDRIPPGAEKHHTILTVKDTTDESWITIDPAYQQYLQVFWVARETLPQNDVMVLRAKDVKIRAEQVAQLRNIAQERSWYEPDREVRRKNWPFPYAVPIGEVTDFFESLWTPATYQISPLKPLSESIVWYEADPSNVPEKTGRLIQELGLLES